MRLRRAALSAALVLSAVTLLLSNCLSNIAATGPISVTLLTPSNGSMVTATPVTLAVLITNTTNGRPISKAYAYFNVEDPQSSRYSRVGYAISGSDGQASVANYNPPFAGTYSWYVSVADGKYRWNNSPQNETITGNSPWSFVTNSVSTLTFSQTQTQTQMQTQMVAATTSTFSTTSTVTQQDPCVSMGTCTTYTQVSWTTSTVTDQEPYTVGLSTAYQYQYQTISQIVTAFATQTASFTVTSNYYSTTSFTVPVSTVTTASITSVTATLSQTVLKSVTQTRYVYVESNASATNPALQRSPEAIQDPLVGLLRSLPLPIVGMVAGGLVCATLLFYRLKSKRASKNEEGEEE